jgi:hypothetical protein
MNEESHFEVSFLGGFGEVSRRNEPVFSVHDYAHGWYRAKNRARIERKKSASFKAPGGKEEEGEGESKQRKTR